MDELRQHAGNPTWQQVETSSLIYHYPLSLKDLPSPEELAVLSRGIPAKDLRSVGNFLVTVSPESHIGPFNQALDFLVMDGSSVLAANDGRIVEVIDTFNEWGDNPEYRSRLNYLTIAHTLPGRQVEFSQYCHLAQGSVRGFNLKIGSLVRAGQEIARVGKTGWTDRDHLHFIVFRGEPQSRINPFGFRSLEIRFIS